MTTTETMTTTLFLAFNEDGDVAADADRDTAIDRLKDEYGGNFCRVVEMKVAIPNFVDMHASFTVPAERVETVEVTA